MHRRFWPAHAALLAFAVLACPGANSANAATYVVNTVDVDLPDTNVGLANCDANAAVLGDQCTLRAAIMQANAAPGEDTIVLPLDTTIALTLGGIGGAESGDLDVTAPLIITGIPLGAPADLNRLPAITAPANDRIFDLGAGVTLELRGLRLSGGTPSGAAASNGGALRITSAAAQVLVDRVRFSDNEGGNGAAISNAGTLEVIDSDFARNRTTGNGAAIFTSGSTTLRRSSIRGIRDSSGHAEALYAALDSTLIVENTLINGNPPAIGATATGGIFADRPALLQVRNSTLNDFTDVALDIIADGTSQIGIYNSILAASDDADCRIGVIAGPAPIIAIEYNQIQDSECQAFHGVGTFGGAPFLDGLANDPVRLVWTQSLLFGSDAVDMAIPADAMGGNPARLCTDVDQIGTPRPQDGDASGSARCDMGATELGTLTSSTYVVNLYNADLVDINPGDGHCDGLAVMVGDQCTLRAAVMEANAKPGPDRIEFSEGGTVTLTIDGPGGAEQGDLDISEELDIVGLLVDGRPVNAVTTTIGQRLFDINVPVGQRVELNRLRMHGGASSGQGGAVRVVSGLSLSIADSELFDNFANGGGGAIAALDSLLFVRNSDVHDNAAGTLGAAIYAARLASLNDSSFWNNTNSDPVDREAVRLEGIGSNLNNLTLSGNSGGISIEASGLGNIRLNALTLINNAQYGLRAVGLDGSPQVIVRSSILADNGLDCSNGGGLQFTSDNYNLIGDGSCAGGATNLSGSPMLAPALARFDGQISRVHIPLPGSPVLDGVPNGHPGCLSSDQYGEFRPKDSDSNGIAACEIGSVELSQAEASPQSWVVNVFDQDRDDSNPGDTLCDTSSEIGQQCTLRAAIMEANALPGANTVQIVTPSANLMVTQPNAGGAASAAHGDLDITDALTLTGVSGSPGLRPTITSTSGDRIFNINAPGDNVIIRGLRLTGGATSGTGGAIRVVNAADVQIDRVEMYANSADQGGGAVSVVGGVVTLDRSDLHDNGTAGEGAAVRNSADLTVYASSIRDNLDLQPAGQREAVSGVGGGITRILNSTLSGNNGHAVDADDGTLQIENSSLIANDRRGIEFQSLTGRTLFLRNTVISGNTDGACIAPGLGAPTISTDGYNYAQDSGCQIQLGTSNVINADAGIGALVVDPTRFSAYYLPQSGSPLIDAGHPLVGGLGCIETDQLGTARPVDGDGNGQARCDIGAIEAPFVALPDQMFSDGFED